MKMYHIKKEMSISKLKVIKYFFLINFTIKKEFSNLIHIMVERVSR